MVRQNRNIGVDHLWCRDIFITNSGGGRFRTAFPATDKSSQMVRYKLFSTLLFVLILSACGGGGSSQGAPSAPGLILNPESIKTFHFSWTDVNGEVEYRLLEDPDSLSGYTQVATIMANATSYDLEVSLPKRITARYILQACNSAGCSDSDQMSVAGTLAEAIGYIKASNTGLYDGFGIAVAMSEDGNTLAVGASSEASSASGTNGDQSNDSSWFAGAVYLFSRSGTTWIQQAYLKASNTDGGDQFGRSVALSGDGNTLAVGAVYEDSNATGIDGSQADNSATDSGAVYLFSRSGVNWSHQAYVKASNTEARDSFGASVALSGDGNTLAVGAYGEDSSAVGIDGNQVNNLATDSGAVYLFSRSGTSWGQQAYLKASNSEKLDFFGRSVALSRDGNTLAVGSDREDSSATNINGNQVNNSATDSGAVYLFSRSGVSWIQQAYVKASNAGVFDGFGWSVSLSGDGNTLAVGAFYESSSATGIDGNQSDDSAYSSGAVYLFSRNVTGWGQQAYIKASNAEAFDHFGCAIALSRDGNTLAVGAFGEESSAIGINGNQLDNSSSQSGATYLFSRSGTNWSRQAYIKAPNTEEGDNFGLALSLSGDGNTLAVGAYHESSNAGGVDGNQSDNSASNSGAVYLY